MAANSENDAPDAAKRPPGALEYNLLTHEEEHVILHKGTEFAGTGEYTDLTRKQGLYVLRQAALQCPAVFVEGQIRQPLRVAKF